MSRDNNNADTLTMKPYTVSAVYDDGLEAVIKHCMTTDAQAARDQVIMETNGRVIIASVFNGHLSEPDAIVFHTDEPEEETAGMCM